MTLRRVLLAAAVAGWGAALTGCAYWNGMYNTKRFAGRAERSERAGRTSEAADRWRQVLVHADTLLARHPRSRWADDAELLKGRALVALRAWTEAVAVLESARERAGTEDQLREAQYWLAVAQAGRGAYAAALSSFDSALASPHRDERQKVRLARGRTLLAMGRAAEALRDFEAVAQPAARFDRAQAALALGLPELAASFADSAAHVGGIRMEAWASFLDTLGRRGGASLASGLVDHLLARGDLSSGARARLLLADGDRWAAQGSDSVALVRWEATVRAAPDSAEARTAAGREERLRLRGPDALSQLPAIRQRLDAIASAGGEPGRDAREVLRVLTIIDSVAQSGGLSDARAFQAAEWLRDSLQAPALAVEGFTAMVARWPDSPWAPKALAAAIAAGHPAPDSLTRVLRDRYGESPYTGAALGQEPDPVRYAALEDSLGRALEVALAPAAGGMTVLRSQDEDDRIVAQRNAERTVRPRTATAAAPPPAPVRAARARPSTLPRDPEP